jgi:hypothetical protein
MNIKGATRLDARVDPGNIGPGLNKDVEFANNKRENKSNNGVSVCEFELDMNVHFHLIEGNGTILLRT